MVKLVRALGLMSGTSLDGIDVAMIETDGEAVVHRGAAMTFPYTPAMRRQLADALADARLITSRDQRPGMLAATEHELTELHAAAVSAFCRKQGIPRKSVGVVGFHGQTVLHRPEQKLTVQLGLGPLLSELIALPVVYDLRAADVEAGGQGAPLVPVYHRALSGRLDQRPLAVLNIGGVANVTWIGPGGALIAFDTGPGNALLDDWMMRHTRVPCDMDGAIAATGRVHEDVVRFYISHSFFSTPPPKSLDRQAFFWDLVEGLSVADGAATLTALTVEAIARSREFMPDQPALWVVCGGGRKNRTLMSGLAGRVENAVVPAEAVGFDGDSLEAEAWAYLAVRALSHRPITYPGTTGAPYPMTGGKVAGQKAAFDAASVVERN
ncbi:MAG: anhydro-N-acetylmuramic acid kinase [Hyphomicrobium sp.]|nr:MAG: anhydro-N-acetylmuramic acid kinase [Hyphomicrobium sp.]